MFKRKFLLLYVELFKNNSLNDLYEKIKLIGENTNKHTSKKSTKGLCKFIATFVILLLNYLEYRSQSCYSMWHSGIL